ncbi:unnamed protein product, partial [Prorocentrum cordatum]
RRSRSSRSKKRPPRPPPLPLPPLGFPAASPAAAGRAHGGAARRGGGPGAEEMEVPISPAGLDTLLSRMTVALNRVEASQGSAVRGRRAELELLTELGHVRDFMRQAAQDTEHREAFHEIFDECSRVARVRVLCEEVRLSESNCADARLKGCLDSCKAVEAIVLQKGWARSRLRQAVARERELFVDDQSCSGRVLGCRQWSW